MAKKSKTGPSKPNIIVQTRIFSQEVRSEMSKVTWPSQDDLKANTSVVLLFLFFIAAIVGTMDIVFQNIVLWLFRLT